MSHLAQTITKNRLLTSLALEELNFLHAHLERVPLKMRDVLIEPNEVIPYVWFVESGLASIVTAPTLNKAAEVGLVGCEGMIGTPVLLGTDRAPCGVVIQGGGTALRISAQDMRQVIVERPPIHAHLLLYIQAFLVQVSQTAAADACFNLRERLARWLLMAHDRVPGDEVPLTHGSLALMLGVRRAGVTTALHMLESDDAIRGHRSRITVLSRARLEQAAGPSYGVPEREYVRLYGLPRKEGLSAARGLALAPMTAGRAGELGA